jgi:GTPase SAR1 family protein
MLVEVDFSHNVLEDNDVCQIVGALACIRTIAVVSFEDNRCGPCPQVVKSAAWSSCKLARPTDEIISGGWNSVAKFLKQKEFKPIHKTRLMFIGRGVSGKTRLVRALLQGSAASIDVQTGRTIGIDLSRQLLRLPGKGNEPAIEAVPWDFAGQELSYLSHSVHLSARCVYVLVWSPRKEMEESSRDSVDGIVQPMLEWLQILSSHVPDASIVLVGTHSKTPEGKDKPGVFRDGAYAEEYAKLAEEVQRKVTEEINRLNCIVEQELVHLQRRVLPLVSTRLGAATQLLQELQTCAHVAPSSPSVSSQQPMSPSLQPPISNPLQQSHLHHRQLLLQQSSDVSAPHELRRCAEEVLYLERLEAATQERMRRLCGVRDGSKPREDAVAVKMRLMMTSQVDSSNQSGIPELKEELSFCCRGLRFVGESVPMSWIRVEEAIDKLQQQSLTVSEACREILKLMQTELQGSSSVATTLLNEIDIEEALEFWSQLGRVFMQDGQLFPKPQLVVDLIRPLVHHKPMNLLNNTERLGLLKEPSLQSGALYDEARQHLQVLEARNEVHEDFLAKHVTSWSQLSEQQARVMLNFFVACALLSEIENRRGTYLVTARLRNLPSVQQLATPAADISASAVLSSAGDLSSEMRERLEISAAREDMMRSIQQSLQTFMQPAHCAAQVIPLVLGTTHVSDREVSPSLCVRANEAFFLLPIRHIAVLARLQARMVQAQPRGISVNMHMFSDGVVISRGKSLCAAVVRCWSPSERSPKLRDRVVNLDCVLHLVSNDDGMFRFMSRCIEGIIETAFAGLRYECWCPVRDQHGNTFDWMQFDGGSAHAVAQSLSSTLEDKNIFDVIFDRQQLHQLFALCCPIFISHAWNDGTSLFVKRLKRHIETQALVSVWCDYLQLDQQQGAVEVKFREGLCKASVILVCLTPRYLTRPNCLRELQWALDFAYKAEKDVRILPLHPALTFAGIQAIAQHGCVCVSNANGTHKVHRLSAKAVELVVKLKQYMCLSWSDLQPWASDALGESWPEHVLAADGSVISMVTGDGGRPVGLVDELVSKIADKLGFNDRPSKVGDCKEMEDKDLEASAVADADVPANLLDSYPELSPAFRQRVQDCSDRNKRVADAILRHRGASSALAAGASAAPPPAAPAPPVAPSSAVHAINIQGVFVKTKSHLFPSLKKTTR